MRLIIHNLGKFLSHRDVKELVQSALLESNTSKDDRILYNKLYDIALLWPLKGDRFLTVFWFAIGLLSSG
nr:hypothetical protein CFP56_15761 [Quercus suber]